MKKHTKRKISPFKKEAPEPIASYPVAYLAKWFLSFLTNIDSNYIDSISEKLTLPFDMTG